MKKMMIILMTALMMSCQGKQNSQPATSKTINNAAKSLTNSVTEEKTAKTKAKPKKRDCRDIRCNCPIEAPNFTITSPVGLTLETVQIEPEPKKLRCVQRKTKIGCWFSNQKTNASLTISAPDHSPLDVELSIKSGRDNNCCACPWVKVTPSTIELTPNKK